MLPPGLELITQEEATEMAKTTNENCTNCGRKGVLSVLHGGKVCNTCRYLLAAANNNVPALAGAVRTVGKVEEMIKSLMPDGGRLAVQVTADLLQEISGLVGYDGEDPQELVAAVRRRALTCASCEAEDVLHEIREIVGYSPDMGDSGLADAVRRVVASATPSGESEQHRDDLMRACGFDKTQRDLTEEWEPVYLAAIQTIAELTNRRDDLVALLTRERADNAQTHSESEELADLSQDFERALHDIETAHEKLTLAEQSRDEWERRAVQAEANVETLEAELRNREDAPAAPCASTTYLLDIALKALRGEGPDADQLATLIDAARGAA
jgi:ribosomal protein L37AE/L43A